MSVMRYTETFANPVYQIITIKLFTALVDM